MAKKKKGRKAEGAAAGEPGEERPPSVTDETTGGKTEEQTGETTGTTASRIRAIRRTGTTSTSSPEMGVLTSLLLMVMGLGVWVLLGLLVVGVFSETTRRFLGDYWLWILGTTVACGVLGFASSKLGESLREQPAGRRQAVLAMTIIPFIIVVVIGLVFVASTYRLLLFRSAIVLVACLLPGALLYLFLATRRTSILNDFVKSVGRLGLFKYLMMQPRRDEDAAMVDDATATGGDSLAAESVWVWRESDGAALKRAETRPERRSRVQSYFQRFEAMYGPLAFGDGDGSGAGATVVDQTAGGTREEFVDALLDAVDRPDVDALDEGPRLPEAKVRFADLFRSNLLLPVALATGLCAVGWVLVLRPDWTPEMFAAGGDGVVAASIEGAAGGGGDGAPGGAGDGGLEHERDPWVVLRPIATPVNFAFLGAYFFSLNSLFRRYAGRDLGTNAFFRFSLRIVIATIAVWVTMACYTVLESAFLVNIRTALVAPLDPDRRWPALMLVLAFTVGVFPHILWQLVGAVFTKAFFLHVAVPSLKTKQPLSLLDGLTIWNESRFEEEDIENVPNMATTDVVNLLLHTQIPVSRLVDWIDQAILLKALGPETDGAKPSETLRKHGISSATQLVAGYAACRSPKARSEFAALLGAADAPTPIPILVRTIYFEPNYDLVRSWKGLPRYQFSPL